MKFLFFLLLLLSNCICGLLADECQYILKSDPEIEQAEILLANLNREIQSFLRSKEHNLFLLEDDLQEEGLLDSELQAIHMLESKIQAVQPLFLEFRKRLAEMVSFDYGDNSQSYSHLSFSILEITKWYVKFIEETLFPRDNGKSPNDESIE
jgi:hypothetical protein